MGLPLWSQMSSLCRVQPQSCWVVEPYSSSAAPQKLPLPIFSVLEGEQLTPSNSIELVISSIPRPSSFFALLHRFLVSSLLLSTVHRAVLKRCPRQQFYQGLRANWLLEVSLRCVELSLFSDQLIPSRKALKYNAKLGRRS